MTARASAGPAEGLRGGGTVPSGSHVLQMEADRQRGVPISQNQIGGTASTEEALLTVGLYVLCRQKRAALAAELEADSVSPQDILDLKDYLFACIETATGKAQRVLAVKLCEPFGRKEMFADLRQHLVAKAKSVIPPAKLDPYEHDHGAGVRQRDMQRVREFERQWADYEKNRAGARLTGIEVQP